LEKKSFGRSELHSLIWCYSSILFLDQKSVILVFGLPEPAATFAGWVLPTPELGFAIQLWS
jgi:hypothetical protein